MSDSLKGRLAIVVLVSLIAISVGTTVYKIDIATRSS